MANGEGEVQHDSPNLERPIPREAFQKSSYGQWAEVPQSNLIEWLNKLFGVTGWRCATGQATVVQDTQAKANNGKELRVVVAQCTARITAKYGSGSIEREAVGAVAMSSPMESAGGTNAYVLALKGAGTSAFKRATFLIGRACGSGVSERDYATLIQEVDTYVEARANEVGGKTESRGRVDRPRQRRRRGTGEKAAAGDVGAGRGGERSPGAGRGVGNTLARTLSAPPEAYQDTQAGAGMRDGERPARRRMNRNELLALARQLSPEKVYGSERSVTVRCPVPGHEDRRPSLTLWLDEDDGMHVHCHGGCGYVQIARAMRARGVGTPFQTKHGVGNDVQVATRGDGARISTRSDGERWAGSAIANGRIAPMLRHATLGPCTRFWTYRSERGGHDYGYAARYEPPEGREYRMWTWWHTKYQGRDRVSLRCRFPPVGRRVLWGMERLAQHGKRPVWVLEGEPSAQRAQWLCPEVVAVCWMGGAENVLKNDWRVLAGREVWLLPDEDWPGHVAMAELEAHLETIAGGPHSVEIVSVATRLPELPGETEPRSKSGWDVADLPASEAIQSRFATWANTMMKEERDARQ